MTALLGVSIVVERFSEYIAQYDGVVRLTENHYKAVRAGRGWPTRDTINKRATPGRTTTWLEMVERGRRYLAPDTS